MEASLAAYSRAGAYGVAEVTTAASYAMADLYRDLASALLVSERPAGLTAEELEQYDLLLEEQAYPFEERAIGIHETNTHRAAEAAPASPPEVVLSLAAARAALDAHDAVAAATQIGAALALDPTNAVALNMLGVANRRLGRFAEARAAYERAVVLAPAYPTPQRNLGVLLDLYLGDPAAALGHYEQYQLLTGGTDPDTGPWLVELRTRLGKVSRTAEAQP